MGGNYNWFVKFRLGVVKDLGMDEFKVLFKDEMDVLYIVNIDVDIGMLVNFEKYVKKVKISEFLEFLIIFVDLIY